ncbi:hypothetical protein [Infirmifilum sp.]|uniref:hypothetical protein n=1 Tax=Infirmifilum sp. TaxID=2856575 RepID=UPI003D1275CE
MELVGEEELRVTFSDIIGVDYPSVEEAISYVQREIGDCLREDARDLKWLEEILGKSRATCHELECFVNRVKSACKEKGERLSRSESVAIYTVPKAW